MQVAAIISGAGSSLRFSPDDGTPPPGHRKQFKLLAGEPLIFRTLRPFVESYPVDSVVMVVPADDVDWTADEVESRHPDKEVIVIPGGEERQDSVRNGLEVVSGDCDIVVVHDAARPFFKKEWIEETVRLCSSFDGAIVAIRAKDTLKRVAGETISGTLPRGEIWHAQTPQSFNFDVLLSAFEHARERSLLGTDEAQLVELNGGRVAVVEGSPLNIKITDRKDWELAEFIWEKLRGD